MILNKLPKTKIAFVCLVILAITSLYLNWYLMFISPQESQATIQELNLGGEFDYKYVNKVADFTKAQYYLHQTCNDLLVKELKGTIKEKDLTEGIQLYKKQADDVLELQKEVEKLKQDRSDLFKSFSHVTVYKPQ